MQAFERIKSRISGGATNDGTLLQMLRQDQIPLGKMIDNVEASCRIMTDENHNKNENLAYRVENTSALLRNNWTGLVLTIAKNINADAVKLFDSALFS